MLSSFRRQNCLATMPSYKGSQRRVKIKRHIEDFELSCLYGKFLNKYGAAHLLFVATSNSMHLAHGHLRALAFLPSRQKSLASQRSYGGTHFSGASLSGRFSCPSIWLDCSFKHAVWSSIYSSSVFVEKVISRPILQPPNSQSLASNPSPSVLGHRDNDMGVVLAFLQGIHTWKLLLFDAFWCFSTAH